MKTLTPPDTREALLADLEPCLFPYDDWPDADLRAEWVAQWVARARQHRLLMRERTHQHASTTPPEAHEMDAVASELTDDDVPF